jgi:hypothetical protein
MLGGGTTLSVVGVLIAKDHSLFDLFGFQPEEANDNFNVGVALTTVGTVAMLGSIPLFIDAKKNKKRAMNVTFTNQPIPAIVSNITKQRSLPSIALRFSLMTITIVFFISIEKTNIS